MKFLNILLFFSLFSFQALANPTSCNQTPAQGSNNYIIGYGSLMERESRMSTNPNAKLVEPILIKNFERLFGHSGGNYKTTFLTLIEKNGAKVNGVYYAVTLEDIIKTDQREKSYCRIKVNSNDLDFYGRKVKLENTNFWVYAANVERLQKPTATHPIVQSYVDIFLNGCFQIQEEFKLESFAKDCVETTKEWSEHWVNDRIHPRRPFAIANAMKIDQLLSKYFTNYYNLKIE
jgi:hypothetical protein